jgi:hypothetical protein
VAAGRLVMMVVLGGRAVAGKARLDTGVQQFVQLPEIKVRYTSASTYHSVSGWHKHPGF